jgi:hypothetical protein
VLVDARNVVGVGLAEAVAVVTTYAGDDFRIER